MRRLVLLLAAASVALAQTDPNIITITASRQLVTQPDQVRLTVEVASDSSRTLDNVLAFLKGTQISAGDLSDVRTPVTDFLMANPTNPVGSPMLALANPVVAAANPVNPELLWTFTPTVSFSDLSSELAALAALPSAGPINLSYFSISATTSPQAMAAQACPYPALINDAQTQAGKLAAAAGVTAGPIVSIEEPAPAQRPAYAYYSVGDFLLGLQEVIYDPFGSVGGAYSSLLYGAILPSPLSCSLAVQFKLGQ